MSNEDAPSSAAIFIDLDIQRLSEAKGLVSPFDPGRLSGCSYDLCVGSKLTSRNRLANFDLTKDDYVVESGECITIDTLETINLREVNAFGVVANKHSLAATGLFHPSTTVDPGFQGPLALTFFNLGNVRYTLRRGEPIAKVFFCSLSGQPERIYGVTQRPSYREGTTNIAAIVDHPQHRDDDDELAKMYGAPVRKLYERLRRFEDNMELIDLRRARERRTRWLTYLIAFLTGSFGALLTNLIRENWSSIAGWYNSIMH